VTLLESSPRVGGVIGSFSQNGFLFEKGPQSFLGTPAILELVREVGIESELLTGDPVRPATFSAAAACIACHSRRKLFSPARSSAVAPGCGPPLNCFAAAGRPSTKSPSPIYSPQIWRRNSGQSGRAIRLRRLRRDPEQLSVRSAFPSLSTWNCNTGACCAAQ